MITSYIGAVFLDAYNAREGTDYDGKRFFTEVMFPLFFDHEKYMLWPSNSPFVQGEKPATAEIRAGKLQTLHEKIGKVTTLADASIALGYPAEGVTGTTSGQVTGMRMPLESEDYYRSWIGTALGIEIKGGWVIFFDEPNILLAVYDGWRYYRDLLERVSSVKGNDTLIWNGCWSHHRFGEDFNPAYPEDNFLLDEKVSTGGIISFETVGWAEIMQGIARHFPRERLMGYIWNWNKIKPIGTYATIGFIPFELPEIIRPLDLYVKLFGIHSAARAKALFGTAAGFERCCQRGSIGIRAMEPQGLRDIMTGRKALRYKPDDEQNKITFQTYLTWLMAMLNNEERWERAREIAELLHRYAQDTTRGKTTKGHEVEDLLESIGRRKFMAHLIPIIEGAADKEAVLAVGKLIDEIPADHVPYLITLIRLHYAAISK